MITWKNVGVQLNLPNIIKVADDYQFDEYKDVLNKLGSARIKIKHLGYDGDYVGLVYTGKLPPKKVINDLLKKEHIIFDDYDYLDHY